MELIDALNLRGWRTAAIIVVACVGAVVGVFVPRTSPFVSQHIVFAGQLTSDNLSPAQIEDFTDELRLAAGLPAVRDAVRDEIPGEFEVEVGSTTSDSSIRITANSVDEATARESSRQIGVEAARFVVGQSISRNDSLIGALEGELTTVRTAQDAIADQAGGLEPTSALTVASELLFTTQQDAAAGDTASVIRAAALEEQIEILRPLAQRYSRLEQDAAALNQELGNARADSARGQNALENIENELFITELSTKPQSSAPKLVQNMLLFAGLNVIALVLVFFLIDRLGKGGSASSKKDNAEREDSIDAPAAAPAVVASQTPAETTTPSAKDYETIDLSKVEEAADPAARIEAPPARLVAQEVDRDTASTSSRSRSNRQRRLGGNTSSSTSRRSGIETASPDPAHSAVETDDDAKADAPARPTRPPSTKPKKKTNPTSNGSGRAADNANPSGTKKKNTSASEAKRVS